MIGRWQCRHPIPIQDHKFGGILTFARCNQCVNCVLRRKAIWTGRNTLEWVDQSQIGTFTTLTYDDQHLGDASYKDIQLLHNNLRRLQALRFYCAPDYGDRFGRFHWHLLYHGVEHDSEEFQDALKKHWVHGTTHSEPIIPERIGYTCAYVTKKLTGINPGRQNQSLGLGISHFLHWGTELANANKPLTAYPRLLKIFGKHYPIDATCRRAIKKGFTTAGGVPCLELDYAKRPADWERVYHVIVNEKLGGSIADKITTDRQNVKTLTQAKTYKNKRHYPPPAVKLI